MEKSISVSSLLERPAARGKQIAGRLCLDFTNGVGGWQLHKGTSGKREFKPRDDRFRDYADLAAWALRAGIVNETQTKGLMREAVAHAPAAHAVWKRGLRLRAAIHSIASSLEARESPDADDLDVLAREAAFSRERETLRRCGRGAKDASEAANLEWRFPDGPLALDAILSPVARSAEDYFTRGDLSRLHTCPGNDCGWLFEDTTRNRSRRWCDMGDCGNSAKVQKFRARQAKPA
jgi:predicted RNA-binding Zn ribbon-like protein